MKAFIGGIIGALLMAGVLLFVNGQKAPALQAAGTYSPALIQPAPMGQAMVQVPLAQAQAAGLVAVSPNGFPVAPAPMMVPAVQTYAPAQPVVERVVYRDRPVTRTASRAQARYREPARQSRSWKKSALIIGGSAAGGAGLGAIVDGKGGAKKGAIIGGVGGLVYDLVTRNK